MVKKKKKEHIIHTPKIVSSYIKAKLRPSPKVIREERIEVLKFAKKIGPLFSGLTLIFGLGTMLSVFYLYAAGQMVEVLGVKPVMVAFFALSGFINFVSGLLLMGREKP
ncbi:hypothetical protein J7L06_05070, partial [Candidatus Bathyarchaeota archaeon]|nr:hypothetical protein [Candidatus Bathyarchaeota archaeon]